MDLKFIAYLIIAANSICISFSQLLLLVTNNNRLPASVSILSLFVAFLGFMLLLVNKLKTLQLKWLLIYFIFDILVTIVNMLTLLLFNIKYINFFEANIVGNILDIIIDVIFVYIFIKKRAIHTTK